MEDNKYTKLFTAKIGICGKLISWSKSGYRENYPRNLAIFNSNIVVDGKKVWFGDIDLTISKSILKSIAAEEKIDIYVLREMSARFDNEETPDLSEPVAVYYKGETIKYDPYIDSTRYDGL
jgi:hypothetical protein